MVFQCSDVCNIPLKEQRTITRCGYNARLLKVKASVCIPGAHVSPAGRSAASDETATAPKSRWTQWWVQGSSCCSRALLRRPPSCRRMCFVHSICSITWKPLSFFALPHRHYTSPVIYYCSFRLVGRGGKVCCNMKAFDKYFDCMASHKLRCNFRKLQERRETFLSWREFLRVLWLYEGQV